MKEMGTPFWQAVIFTAMNIVNTLWPVFAATIITIIAVNFEIDFYRRVNFRRH